MTNQALTAFQIWGVPILLGVVSAIGLPSALLGDGVWDALSWVALAAPVAVTFWCVGQSWSRGRRPSRGRGRPESNALTSSSMLPV